MLIHGSRFCRFRIFLNKHDPATSTPVPVAVYENMGDERRISLRVGDNLLSITTTDDVYYEKGDEVYLKFNSEKTHLFDVNTGDRIRV